MDVRPATVLAGGVGAARFLQGLLDVVPAENVAIVGNVGDDVDVAGLHVSPHPATALYTPSRWIDPGRGWGVRGATPSPLGRAPNPRAHGWVWLRRLGPRP